MTFWTWMKMSMFFDICFVVFSIFFIWKIYKHSKQIEKLNDKIDSVIKNPQAAKRNLIKNK